MNWLKIIEKLSEVDVDKADKLLKLLGDSDEG